MKLRLVLVSLALSAVAALAAAEPRDEVAAATRAWATAYNSRDPEQILALYEKDAVLWGTTSPVLRDTPESIRDYFKAMPERPLARVALGEQRIRVLGDVAMNTGYYTFTNVRDGQTESSPARFSFTYRKQDGRWLIISHHSSGVPPSRPK
jgi:uncharacterized protein (TIGR02246 family)